MDIESMYIFGHTPLEQLFYTVRNDKEIEENEIVAIRVLIIIFLRTLQNEKNFKDVSTLILNYALDKKNIDVRKSIIKIHPEFSEELKLKIKNLKTTKELQNELLEDEPLIEKKKQKRRKRKKKNLLNKANNEKKETMKKKNDQQQKKAKKVQFVSTGKNITLKLKLHF